MARGQVEDILGRPEKSLEQRGTDGKPFVFFEVWGNGNYRIGVFFDEQGRVEEEPTEVKGWAAGSPTPQQQVRQWWIWLFQ